MIKIILKKEAIWPFAKTINPYPNQGRNQKEPTIS